MEPQGLKKEIVATSTFNDPRMSSIGQSLGGDHPDVSDSNLREDMCLYDPEALRLESMRGLGVQIRAIN